MLLESCDIDDETDDEDDENTADEHMEYVKNELHSLFRRTARPFWNSEKQDPLYSLMTQAEFADAS